MPDADQAREFLRTNHRGVFYTQRRDGGPAMSPVLASLDGQGRIVVSTRERAVKTRHVRRTGRAALCLFSDRFFGDWVFVEGPTEVVSLPDAMPLLVDYYRSISGEHPDWDDYTASMQREQRVILRMTIERAGPTVSG